MDKRGLLALSATSPSSLDALQDALEQGDLHLLDDPQGSFEAGHPMEFGKHLASAGVVTAKRKHNQTEQGAGS
ncbi:MAG: hypothetical protein ACREXY_18270, partial [Gammaproteobacteria bacterium]